MNIRTARTGRVRAPCDLYLVRSKANHSEVGRRGATLDCALDQLTLGVTGSIK